MANTTDGPLSGIRVIGRRRVRLRSSVAAAALLRGSQWSAAEVVVELNELRQVLHEGALFFSEWRKDAFLHAGDVLAGFVQQPGALRLDEELFRALVVLRRGSGNQAAAFESLQ